MSREMEGMGCPQNSPQALRIAISLSFETVNAARVLQVRLLTVQVVPERRNCAHVSFRRAVDLYVLGSVTDLIAALEMIHWYVILQTYPCATSAN